MIKFLSQYLNQKHTFYYFKEEQFYKDHAELSNDVNQQSLSMKYLRMFY